MLLRRRGAEIAEARGWPQPIAESEACAELTRGRASGRQAKILAFPPQPQLPTRKDN